MGISLTEIAASGLSENLRAAGYMVACMAGFASNDDRMKSPAGSVPITQSVFVREARATALIAAIAWRSGTLRFRPGRRDMGRIDVRIVAEIGGAVAFLIALGQMPLGNITAIVQRVPLTVRLGAARSGRDPRHRLAGAGRRRLRDRPLQAAYFLIKQGRAVFHYTKGEYLQGRGLGLADNW